KANLEQTQRSVDQAKASLDAAQKSYDTGVGNRESAKAAIESAKVGLESALSNRDKLTLQSPVDGVITAKNFDVNEMATQGQPAFIISSPDILQIDLSITQADIGKFSEGQTVSVKIDEQVVDGTVNYVPAVADASSSLYKVEVLIDNSEGQFKSGMSAEVEVSIEKESNVVKVPKKAILEEEGNKYVYIVGDDNNDDAHEKDSDLKK
ncbi:efflux RND transporter periplasmic adaptor subunit, partial [Clostridium butyricum]